MFSKKIKKIFFSKKNCKEKNKKYYKKNSDELTRIK
jgi:hypothetical protein